MKLALGTVQFGIDYGVTNKFGKTSSEEVAKILDYAKGKISVIDTAPSYGTSEHILGINMMEGFNVVTKTPHIHQDNITQADIEVVESVFFQSLNTLKLPAVYGLLIHNSNDMFKQGADKLFDKIHELKRQGYIEKIGISVYSQKEIELLTNQYSFDIVQVPLNVFDQRLVKSGTLKRLKEKKIEIHARSIFLQGILLNETSMLTNKFKELTPLLTNYFTDLKNNQLTKVEGALSFIDSIEEIDQAIIGVDNVSQLKQIYRDYEKIQGTKGCCVDFMKYACENENMIDPRKW
ncbi:MAG: aldo/keto reductase [Bacillus sp. (in: firmicutes)]